jgi:hypothetical protein
VTSLVTMKRYSSHALWYLLIVSKHKYVGGHIRN